MLNYDAEQLLATAKPYEYRKKIMGVYFLFLQDVLVYVGQSVDIEDRVLEHTKTKVFDKYTYLECGKDELDNTERHYINKFKPFYNGTDNKKPLIENMTYVWINNLIFFNCGFSTSRKILRVDGKKIYDVFSNEECGFVYNGSGYVWVKGKTYFCIKGTISEIKLPSMYGRLHVSKDIEVVVAKKDFYQLKTLGDYFVYAKARGYKDDWAVINAKEKGVVFTEQERILAQVCVNTCNIRLLQDWEQKTKVKSSGFLTHQERYEMEELVRSYSKSNGSEQ
jgi:hypothetical protein